MQLTATNPVHEPQPQDLAMEDFRKACRLVAGCKVSADGKLMVYDLKTIADMNTWLACANGIIRTYNLPLIAKVESRMKGKEVVSVQLKIIYNPNPNKIALP